MLYVCNPQASLARSCSLKCNQNNQSISLINNKYSVLSRIIDQQARYNNRPRKILNISTLPFRSINRKPRNRAQIHQLLEN